VIATVSSDRKCVAAIKIKREKNTSDQSNESLNVIFPTPEMSLDAITVIPRTKNNGFRV
jgi:hypothetical protein